MPWGVDDINSMLFELFVHARPKTGRRCRSNSNAALLLLLHPIHGSCAIMDFTKLVRQASVEKNTLSGRGFTRVHMGDNTNIPITLKGRCSSHNFLLLPAVVSESFVSFGHTVNVFTFLNRRTFIFSSVEHFSCKALSH